jgi:transcriptional regulator with XRE-family HTH domain
MTGHELRELRKSAGYKAKSLADALDISAATMSKYENGKAPIPKKTGLAVRYLCERTLSEKPASDRLVDAIQELAKESMAKEDNGGE